MGIEVEGVWISRPNTPVPSPILGPQRGINPSIAPSIIGRASANSSRASITQLAYTYTDENQIDVNPRLGSTKHTRIPSITLDSFASYGRESFDLPLEYPLSEPDNSMAYSSTLDALEGREENWDKRSTYPTYHDSQVTNNL
jgi:hypothetical protein